MTTGSVANLVLLMFFSLEMRTQPRASRRHERRCDDFGGGRHAARVSLRLARLLLTLRRLPTMNKVSFAPDRPTIYLYAAVVPEVSPLQSATPSCQPRTLVPQCMQH